MRDTSCICLSDGLTISGKSTIILWAKFIGALPEYAAVVESADTRDLKSLAGNSVPVQVGSAAPQYFGEPLCGSPKYDPILLEFPLREFIMLRMTAILGTPCVLYNQAAFMPPSNFCAKGGRAWRRNRLAAAFRIVEGFFSYVTFVLICVIFVLFMRCEKC